MDEKERFAILARTGRFSMTQLCLDFGISRKTGQKYLRRYEAGLGSDQRIGRGENGPKKGSRTRARGVKMGGE